MADTVLLNGVTGEVEIDEGNNTIEVTAFDSPLGLRGVFSREDDFLTIKRKCGSAFVAEGDGEVIQLHQKNPSVVISMPGIYGPEGNVNGTVTLYKVAE